MKNGLRRVDLQGDHDLGECELGECKCVSLYPAPRNEFELCFRQVFDHADCLVTSSPLLTKILFSIVVAGSCTGVAGKRESMKSYCKSCCEETQYGFFQPRLNVLRKVGSWRNKDRKDREASSRAAYSC